MDPHRATGIPSLSDGVVLVGGNWIRPLWIIPQYCLGNVRLAENPFGTGVTPIPVLGIG